MEGLEPMPPHGLRRKDGLPRPEPRVRLGLPWPDAAGVRVDKLKNLELWTFVEPEVVPEVFLVEHLVHHFSDDLKPFDKARVPLTWVKDHASAHTTVVLIDDEMSYW